jgi:predicted ATPase
MVEPVGSSFAEQLAASMRRAHFKVTPGLLSKLSGLPKPTLVNWLEGRVKRPRRWQDIARVADALRLSEPSASALLVSAGHPDVTGLLNAAAQSRDLELLNLWAHSARERALRSALPEAGLLVGRRAQAADIIRLLLRDGRRLVTVTGMPGAGKTHLALDVARTIEDRFECKVLWIPLASLPRSSTLTDAVARALGRSIPSADMLTRVALDEFGGRSVLWLIDNAEHVTDAAPSIMSLLAAVPGISVLLTSRASLLCPGEFEVRVEPFAVPSAAQLRSPNALRRHPAVRMFCTLAHANDPKFAESDDVLPHVGAIVRRVDGVPLAISLAAAQLKLFSPAALAATLNERLAVLSSPTMGVDGRRQTLRSAIDWSHALLSPEQRLVFRRCALFEDGWTVASCAAVADRAHETAERSVIADLRVLAENGLIVAEVGRGGEPRFRMLDTMREYALVQVREHGDCSPTEIRLVRYFCDLVRDASAACASGSGGRPTDILRDEAANIRQALGLAIEQADPRAALTMATAWSIWETDGDLATARILIERALALTSGLRDAGLLRLRAKAQRSLGILAVGRKAFAEAAKHLKASLEAMVRCADRRESAVAHCDLALVAYFRGNVEACRRHAAEALAYFEGESPVPHRELAHTYLCLALADFDGATALSGRLCRKALDHSESAGEAMLCAQIQHVQGLIAIRDDRLSVAAQKFCSSIQSASARPTSIAFESVAGLGVVAALQGEVRKSIALLAAAERGLRDVRTIRPCLRPLTSGIQLARRTIGQSQDAATIASWSATGEHFDPATALSFARRPRLGS